MIGRCDKKEAHLLLRKINNLCAVSDHEAAFASAMTLVGMCAERLNMCPNELADAFGIMMANYEEFWKENNSKEFQEAHVRHPNVKIGENGRSVNCSWKLKDAWRKKDS